MAASGRGTTARADGRHPVIFVTGMAFEARIAAGEGADRDGVETVFAARRALLEPALRALAARGCAGIVSFGTAGGLAPDLLPGALIVADAVEGPAGRVPTDPAWTERIANACSSFPALKPKLRRGAIAAVAVPLTGADDKAALHRATGALAVDMESHLAATVAAELGVPFAVCRAIVDPAWRSLPSAATAGLQDDGRTAILPILRELLRQPSQIVPLIQLAGDARSANQTLLAARRALGRAGALRFSPA
ncbi:phosphorylase [Paraburkholderia sp.]|uniref:phosphorylase n=1 Tax=Paraburkholderia sp. TaxID=1926495 RepID=UPI0023985B14|nr:phosphorylase [Paraburkholderia sp.]MDE1180259.1 phosphorylase [Paraburkholderia sp.]